jgi:CubicO group peptidase (beta-lactamase class C family)
MVSCVRSRLVPALVAILLAAACSGGGSDGGDGGSAGDEGAEPSAEGSETTAGATDAVYPGDEWARAEAAEMGFDQAKLDEIAARAEAANSSCLVVTRKGEVVGEWYWDGEPTTTHEVFSVTKSVTSTLVGLAQAEGDLDIDDPAAEYIPEWEGTESADVTVRNLISNDSGREWSLALDYGQLPRAPDRTAFAVGLGQDSPPGTTWAYNNAAIQTLEEVLRNATGGDVADFAGEHLFEPIGMAETHMTRDGADHAATFFGVQSTCEDLARFGYLFLRDGNWEGEQVLPEEWVEEATGGSSQDINDAYGFLWWLNRTGTVVGPVQATTAQGAGERVEGQMVPGAPEDMFWALGLQNQIVAVDPGSETVVVRLGGNPDSGQPEFDQAQAARVVTEALAEP